MRQTNERNGKQNDELKMISQRGWPAIKITDNFMNKRLLWPHIQ